jgi:hypothetical protein
MLFPFTAVVLAFFVAAKAEVLQREAVEFTVEGSDLVGTGVIDFKLPIPSTEVDSEFVPVGSYTSFVSTTTCAEITSTETPSVDTSSLSNPRPITPSQTPPPFPTTNHGSPRGSTGFSRPTPTPDSPEISGAISLRHMAHRSSLSLAVMGLCLSYLLS